MTELWASKRPLLAWLPPCPTRHSPVLEPVGLKSDGGLDWFFRVDEAFAGWMCRTIRKARVANAELSSETLDAYRVVRGYLEDKTPGCWAGVERAASAGPVPLPGSEIIPRAAELAKFGFGPRWDGWEKFVTETVDEVPQTPQPVRAVTRPRRPEKPGMFD